MVFALVFVFPQMAHLNPNSERQLVVLAPTVWEPLIIEKCRDLLLQRDVVQHLSSRQSQQFQQEPSVVVELLPWSSAPPYQLVVAGHAVDVCNHTQVVAKHQLHIAVGKRNLRPSTPRSTPRHRTPRQTV